MLPDGARLDAIDGKCVFACRSSGMVQRRYGIGRRSENVTPARLIEVLAPPGEHAKTDPLPRGASNS
jgi:hypothetical protein